MNDSELLKKIEEALDNITGVQCSDGNWNYDAYMRGMANGLLLAQSLFKNKEPEYFKEPDKYLCDLPQPAYEIEQDEVGPIDMWPLYENE